MSSGEKIVIFIRFLQVSTFSIVLNKYLCAQTVYDCKCFRSFHPIRNMERITLARSHFHLFLFMVKINYCYRRYQVVFFAAAMTKQEANRSKVGFFFISIPLAVQDRKEATINPVNRENWTIECRTHRNPTTATC